MQFFFAADRGSNHVNDRYDILSRPALGFLKFIRDNANNATLSVCGEHAGRLIEVLALIGIGYRNFSMAPTAIGAIKELILKTDTQKVRDFVCQYLADENKIENFNLRNALKEFAIEQGYTA